MALNDPTTVNLGNGVTMAVANRSHSITVRYYGENDASGTGADNVILDCLGNPVPQTTWFPRPCLLRPIQQRQRTHALLQYQTQQCRRTDGNADGSRRGEPADSLRR